MKTTTTISLFQTDRLSGLALFEKGNNGSRLLKLWQGLDWDEPYLDWSDQYGAIDTILCNPTDYQNGKATNPIVKELKVAFHLPGLLKVAKGVGVPTGRMWHRQVLAQNKIDLGAYGTKLQAKIARAAESASVQAYFQGLVELVPIGPPPKIEGAFANSPHNRFSLQGYI